MSGRKTTVSREHLIAIIPPVRVRHLVGVDIPATTTPVAIDHAKQKQTSISHIQNHPYLHPLKYNNELRII